MFFELLFGCVDQTVGLVARFGGGATLLVLIGELLGILDHLVDIGIRKPARGLDLDQLFLAIALVLGGNMANAVGVDVEQIGRASSRERGCQYGEISGGAVTVKK